MRRWNQAVLGFISDIGELFLFFVGVDLVITSYVCCKIHILPVNTDFSLHSMNNCSAGTVVLRLLRDFGWGFPSALIVLFALWHLLYGNVTRQSAVVCSGLAFASLRYFWIGLCLPWPCAWSSPLVLTLGFLLLAIGTIDFARTAVHRLSDES